MLLGVSVKDAVSADDIKGMAKNPLIFALANPDPEIRPEAVHAVRPDAITATGRSDYNNQVNNVMCFPYLFRGALDVHAKKINTAMKIAAAEAIANLARKEVPNAVAQAYAGENMKYGSSYIIPKPFDHRLLPEVSVAVAKAAIKTGVARKIIDNLQEYYDDLATRLNPVDSIIHLLQERLRRSPKRIIFAEGEELNSIKTAKLWRNSGYGTPILVGYKEKILHNMQKLGIEDTGIEIVNASLIDDLSPMINRLYNRLQRRGFLYRDCARLVKRDRTIFSSLLLGQGYADAMLSGLTRSHRRLISDVSKTIDTHEDNILFSYSVLTTKQTTALIADTMINEHLKAEDLAKVARQLSQEAKIFGLEPRVAFVCNSTFGSCAVESVKDIQGAIKILDKQKQNFEYDGEMRADVALSQTMLDKYPFTRLSGPANILIMTRTESANVATSMLQELGKGSIIGPILCGFQKSVQILRIDIQEEDMLRLAAIAALRPSDSTKD